MSVLRPSALACVALALSLLATPVWAQWKWRDKDGRITVSDLPPPRDVPVKDILQRPTAQAPRAAEPSAPPASTPSDGATAAPARDKALEDRKRAAEQEQASKRQAEEAKVAQQRQENCRSARSHLAALDSGQRIARINDKGEREVIDDAQRAAEVQRARQVIASECR